MTEDAGAADFFFQDDDGETQGPVSAAQLCGWFEEGWFSVDTLVRAVGDITFRELGSVVDLPIRRGVENLGACVEVLFYMYIVVACPRACVEGLFYRWHCVKMLCVGRR